VRPVLDEGVSVTWFRRSTEEPAIAPADCAQLLTTTRRFPRRVEEESAPLSDAETVRRWIRTLHADQQVHVRRPWGTVLAVHDGKPPVRVFLADGEKSWVAEPPDATTKAKGGYADMTLEQVEHVMVDALTSPDRPQWPRWSFLV
jgi:hypothetical protein